MAKAPVAIYSKYIEIIEKHENGDLECQGSKSTDAKGRLKKIKVYHFRQINNMEEDTAHAVLNLVLSGKMALTNLERRKGRK